jgi:hypothetical protein
MSEEQTAPESSAETAPVGSTPGTGADVPPDRLAINPRSPHFDGDKLQRGVGIRFKGAERTDVEEYSISEGWVRVALGKKVDRHGNPLTIKLSGPVEAYFHTAADSDEGADEAE